MYRRCLRQPWIASPRFINYVSQVRWRLRKDGQGEALPCPGAPRRDGGRGLRNPGEASLAPTRRMQALCPRRARRNPRPSPLKPPSLESARAASAAGGAGLRLLQ
ncbi:MAG: hypothetical protein LBM98_08490 [Oscillospiraceae bacterium]|nr:hypothetical protein [Oscillospiraceae bacterium]